MTIFFLYQLPLKRLFLYFFLCIFFFAFLGTQSVRAAGYGSNTTSVTLIPLDSSHKQINAPNDRVDVNSPDYVRFIFKNANSGNEISYGSHYNPGSDNESDYGFYFIYTEPSKCDIHPQDNTCFNVDHALTNGGEIEKAGGHWANFVKDDSQQEILSTKFDDFKNNNYEVLTNDNSLIFDIPIKGNLERGTYTTSAQIQSIAYGLWKIYAPGSGTTGDKEYHYGFIGSSPPIVQLGSGTLPVYPPGAITNPTDQRAAIQIGSSSDTAHPKIFKLNENIPITVSHIGNVKYHIWVLDPANLSVPDTDKLYYGDLTEDTISLSPGTFTFTSSSGLITKDSTNHTRTFNLASSNDLANAEVCIVQAADGSSADEDLKDKCGVSHSDPFTITGGNPANVSPPSGPAGNNGVYPTWLPYPSTLGGLPLPCDNSSSVPSGGSQNASPGNSQPGQQPATTSSCGCQANQTCIVTNNTTGASGHLCVDNNKIDKTSCGPTCDTPRVCYKSGLNFSTPTCVNVVASADSGSSNFFSSVWNGLAFFFTGQSIGGTNNLASTSQNMPQQSTNATAQTLLAGQNPNTSTSTNFPIGNKISALPNPLKYKQADLTITFPAPLTDPSGKVSYFVFVNLDKTGQLIVSPQPFDCANNATCSHTIPASVFTNALIPYGQNTLIDVIVGSTADTNLAARGYSTTINATGYVGCSDGKTLCYAPEVCGGVGGQNSQNYCTTPPAVPAPPDCAKLCNTSPDYVKCVQSCGQGNLPAPVVCGGKTCNPGDVCVQTEHTEACSTPKGVTCANVYGGSCLNRANCHGGPGQQDCADGTVCCTQGGPNVNTPIPSCLYVDTAVGKIGTDPQSFIQSIFAILLSLSGGIALIIIIYNGYRILTSQGNPESIKKAREWITSGIVGLVFAILSLAILEVIGVNILHLPGFKP